MSNLLKKGMTVSKSERVIDYNEIIKNKLARIMESEKHPVSADGFVSGLNADIVEQLISDDELETQEETSATKEQSLDEIKEQADELINNAHAEAEQIANNAREQGYQEGLSQSQKELELEKARLNSEYEQMKESLQKDYEEKKAQMEPELVEVLTDVFRKVTLTVAQDNQEIIMHLINGVMRNADNSRDFVIKVSPDDYKFLVANQGKIYCAMSREIQLNIIEDATMVRNQCIIETDTGIFNCSLDIELDNLIKDLKLLSCT